MNQEFLSQLHDPDPKVRRAVTKELRTVIDPSVRSVWLTKLSDADEIVRRNAVIGLSNWDEPETESVILPLLSDTAFDVRCAAIEVLCKLTCRSERALNSLRQHFWQVQQASARIYRKHGMERREHDLLYRSLYKIDPSFETWLKRQSANKSEQAYLNTLETTKLRIVQTDILEKEAISLLLGSGLSSKAAHDLGIVYFDRYILAYIFENASELRYLPGKSLRGTLGIRVDFDFDSWVSVANVFDLRFNAADAEPIINSLCSALLNDEDDEHKRIRYACVHVLRALKDERSIPALKVVAKRYPYTTDDEGEEARDALSEIEAATMTVRLVRMTSESFEKLALKLK